MGEAIGTILPMAVGVALMVVLCAVIAAKLVGDGIAGLTA